MSDVATPLISIAEARRRVLEAVTPLDAERIAVTDSLDRVLAEDVVATTDVPPFPSSAMDGYALEPGPAGRELRLVGESRAGAPADRELQPGEAIRISTGGAIQFVGRSSAREACVKRAVPGDDQAIAIEISTASQCGSCS